MAALILPLVLLAIVAGLTALFVTLPFRHRLARAVGAVAIMGIGLTIIGAGALVLLLAAALSDDDLGTSRIVATGPASPDDYDIDGMSCAGVKADQGAGHVAVAGRLTNQATERSAFVLVVRFHLDDRRLDRRRVEVEELEPGETGEWQTGLWLGRSTEESDRVSDIACKFGPVALAHETGYV